MSFATVPPTDLATLFCLAVVRQQWPGEVPSIGAAAQQLGVCRELPSRLRARFLAPVVDLIGSRSRPGPKPADPHLQASQRRLRMVEALLAVARAIIATAGLAALTPKRRQQVVEAVEHLHAEHNIPLQTIAGQLGLSDRTLRRLRANHAAGDPLLPKSRAPKQPNGRVPMPLAVAIALYVSIFPAVPIAELYRRFITRHRRTCTTYDHPNLAYSTFARHAGRPQIEASSASEVHQPNRGRDAPDKLPLGALALMDTTDVSCFGFDFKLIGFMEAHCREVFAHQLCDHDRAEHISQVLREGQQSSGGVLALRIDRGTPYLAELTTTTAQDCGIDIRVAQAYTPTDKAVLERFFRTAKEAMQAALNCIDLSQGPGDLDYRRRLARTLATAVIAGYLRWGYPYIPQPYIDGRSPRERFEQAPPVSLQVIRAALDERVRHHEHAKTLARELHDSYGFRWSVGRWLKAVRGFTAEDLREASRRFDRKLLQGCFTCDSRRNPKYLLAIIRDVADQRRLAQRQRRELEARAHAISSKHDEMTRAVQRDEEQRKTDPEGAVRKAIDLARVALDNHGYCLSVAQAWLDAALQAIAARGQTALDLAVRPVLSSISDHNELKTWVLTRLHLLRVPLRSFAQDIALEGA